MSSNSEKINNRISPKMMCQNSIEVSLLEDIVKRIAEFKKRICATGPSPDPTINQKDVSS